MALLTVKKEVVTPDQLDFEMAEPPPMASSSTANSEWNVGKSLAEMMEYILENDEGTRKDVTFIVGPEKQEITAHKLFLALASPRFAHVLYDSSQAQNVTGHLHIVLSDVTVKAFKMVLRYIYTKQVDVPMEDAIDLLKASFLFRLPDLVVRCRCVLQYGISAETAAEIYQETVTNFPTENSLREYALEYIQLNAKRVFKTPAFLNLSQDSVCRILESDHLIAKEYDVFQAAIKWAENSIRNKQSVQDVKFTGQSIRDELGPALFLIRFPLLTFSEFKSHVKPRQILTDTEQLNICLFYLDESKEDSLTDLHPFSKVKRAQRTTVAEITSPTGEEPPRKILRTELLVKDKVCLRNFSSLCPVPPMPPRISSSAEDKDSISRINVNESVITEAAEPTAIAVKCKSQGQAKNESHSSEGKKINLQEKLDSPEKTLKSLFRTLKANKETIVEIREVKPVVINPLPVISSINFPNLKGFHINYTHNISTVTQFKEHLKRLDLNSLIFYEFCQDKNFGEIWKKEVNTTIVINGVTILKMDFDHRELVLSRTKEARFIVEGLLSNPILKRISLEECSIKSLEHIPTEMLESLTIRRVLGVKNRSQFLQKCKNLKELSCADMGWEKLDLGIDLGFFEGTKLRRIALGNAIISCAKPVKMMNNHVEELYLNDCRWSLDCIKFLPLIFPKLKRVKIWQMGRHCEPELLKSLLEIRTMEWMLFVNMPFQSGSIPEKARQFSPFQTYLSENELSELEKFLKEVGLKTEEESTLILEKVPVLGVPVSQLQQDQVIEKRWKATQLNHFDEQFTRMDYDQFDWSMFYKDYSVFKIMNVVKKWQSPQSHPEDMTF